MSMSKCAKLIHAKTLRKWPKIANSISVKKKCYHDQESWRISALIRCVETEPREAECQLGSFLPSQEKLVSTLTYTGGANTLLVAQRPEERLFTWCMENSFSKPNRNK